MPSFRFLLPALALLALCPACKRAEPRVYLAPRELSSAAAEEPAAPPMAIPKAPEAPHPQVAYDTPPGWVPGEAGQLGGIGFEIADPDGKATVKVTPMGSFAGREEMLINMWRNQVGAAPVSPEEARKDLSDVAIGSAHGQIFEVHGTQEGKAVRIVTAMLHRPDGTWFFKLAGDDAMVTSQKRAFVEFLKSFRFQEPGAGVDGKPKSE